MKLHDAYRILNLDTSATLEDVKRQYRELARRYHPDSNPGSPRAGEMFDQVTKAYQAIINDPDKSWDLEQASPEVLLEIPGLTINQIAEAFDSSNASYERLLLRTPLQGEDIFAEIKVPFAKTVYGTTETLMVNRREICHGCNGTGAKPGSLVGHCDRCNGSGKISNLFTEGLLACPSCHGRGQVPTYECPVCDGTGQVEVTEKVTYDIPAGAIDDGEIIIEEKGHSGSQHGKPGNLILKMQVEPDPNFQRIGPVDLLTTLEVSYTEALLGAYKLVQTLSGPESLFVPAGTSHGTQLKIEGHGMMFAGIKGDLFVEIEIVIPKNLTDFERKKLTDIANHRGERIGITMFDPESPPQALF